ncbi:MAG: DHHA1 domain-containing protein [Candidatus Aenigmatarchaeota archaeon]
MEENIIISHNDLDGLISAAIALKFQKNSKIYFTSNLSFKYTFFKVLSKIQNFNNIYFFDLSIKEEIAKISSVLFKKVVWIDHHINERIPNFQNFEIIIDSKSKSASNLVGNYFNFYSPWIEIVNEIDTNNCKREEAKIIRDYFAHLKIKYGKLCNKYFSFLAKKILNFSPEEFINKEDVKNSMIEFEKIKKDFEKFIEENFEIVRIKNLNVGVLETKNTIPPYIVFEYLKEKDIDFLIIIYRGFKGVKLEFRSIKDIDVHNIAKFFNGGGHFKASGAYIPQNLTKSQILSKIEEIL